MPRLELYPFRFRDLLTGKWVRARYVAERHEIAERYSEFEIIGPPEIREVEPNARYFNPFRDERAADASIGNLGPLIDIPERTVGENRRIVLVGVAHRRS